MMTSAYQTTRTGNTGQVFGDPFDFGSGHVDPLKALNPGLVFDSKFEDWQNFLCGVERKPEDTWCRCACVTNNVITSSSSVAFCCACLGRELQALSLPQTHSTAALGSSRVDFVGSLIDTTAPSLQHFCILHPCQPIDMLIC